jgi:hypothetical protein
MTEGPLAQVLADMREQKLDQLDLPRFRYIESLAGRMEGCSRKLAEVLEHKARAALANYGSGQQSIGEPASSPGARQSTLTDLIAYLNGEQPGEEAGLDAQLKQQELELLQAVGEALPEQAKKPLLDQPRELRSARRFRATLQQVGAERRLQQAGRETLQESGPLNPQKLVTESLRIMERLSPAYLERFIVYADTLLWLEQATPADAQQRSQS